MKNKELQVYKISLGQNTSKGKFQEFHTLFVKFTGEKNDLLRAYTKKYAGFTVYISLIKEVEIINDSLSVVEEKIATTEDKQEKTEIYQNKTNGKIYLRIDNSDIKNYDNLIKPIVEAQSNLLKAEEDFKNRIVKMLKVKNINDFERKHNCVTFYTYPNWFNLFKNGE